MRGESDAFVLSFKGISEAKIGIKEAFVDCTIPPEVERRTHSYTKKETSVSLKTITDVAIKVIAILLILRHLTHSNKLNRCYKDNNYYQKIL